VTDRPRLLFLFSDTGGGHRSAAEAILEALEADFPGRYATRLVDVFKEYAPYPLDKTPDAYPEMVRIPQAWGLGYRISDGPRRARTLTRLFWPYVRRAMRRMMRANPADVIVSVHPLFTAATDRALGPNRPALITVVTDLVTGHAMWYHRNVDLCVVPTEAARERALRAGMPPERVQTVGLPVARRFCVPFGDREQLRRELGWPLGLPLVLVVGGGEGMGPMAATARAIAQGGEGRLGLVVVCGRNQRLRRRLEQTEWKVPAFIYGFEHRIPEMMRATDLLVTKAGPGTITEALNAGLPMVLYSRLPGQEDGNVGYVQEEGVGVWAPGPERAAGAALRWLDDPAALQRAAARCREIARPQAARQIAAIIADFAERRTDVRRSPEARSQS
jgi:1,2-diacylglycerol 3-beta-galactosyltransferase